MYCSELIRFIINIVIINVVSMGDCVYAITRQLLSDKQILLGDDIPVGQIGCGCTPGLLR